MKYFKAFNNLRRQTLKMATNRPRTRSSSLEDPSLAIAEPLRTRKRKKPRELSTTEQEEVSKHEIKGERFTYRLRSIRDIIKNISNGAEPHSNKNIERSGKKSRRSNLGSCKRKSIVDTLLTKNFKLSVEVNRVHDATEIQTEKGTEEIKAEEGTEETKAEERTEELTAEKGAEEQENASIEDDIIQQKVNQSEMFENEQKDKKINLEKRGQQIPPRESAEEAETRRKAEQMAGEKTLENIKKLEDEKEKWTELYEKYQKQLSDAQINTESDRTLSYDDDCFSEKQREVLANRIDAQAFVDKLTSYRASHVHHVTRMNNFYETLRKFKENASEYFRSFETSIAETSRESADFETPRKLVSKFIQGAPDS